MRKRALSLAVAMIVGVALVSASGAVTTKAQKVTKIDVSTRAAVVHYLRSILVNPKGAVIQRGSRNYAGAHCPGSGWSCARTKHTVVQIAKRGGTNRFACSSAKCVVVQLSGVSHGMYIAGRRLAANTPTFGTNTATCAKTTGLSQSCTINQSSSTKNNVAVVYQNAPKSSGLTQTATSSATITQQATGIGDSNTPGSGNSNTACVLQNITMDGSTVAKKGTPVTVTLEAHQSVNINQNSLNGNNEATHAATMPPKGVAPICDSGTLAQNQTLSSAATGTASIKQNENAGTIACPDGRATTDYYNMCIDVEQNQGIAKGVATGTNQAVWNQTNTLTAVANTSAGPVNQTQSSNAAGLLGGGLIGTVNQDSTGVSTATTTQKETQCEDAASPSMNEYPLNTATCDQHDADAPSYELHQNQYGPAGVAKLRKHNHRRVPQRTGKGFGQATQSGGNTGDTFTINQKSIQDDDQGTNNNQQNQLEGDCKTPGLCTVNQTVIINGNQTGPVTNSGPDLTGITVDCTGSTCTQSPPPGPICNASSDTSALYNAMPTDVVNCINPGIGFEATSTSEFGDEVGLAGDAGATLGSLNVDFQSWACQSGHWYISGTCSSGSGATFQWPITANIYAVNTDGSRGALLATSGPVTQTIPYRPSATASCPANAGGAPAGAAWFNPMATGGGACQNSIGTVLTFNFPAITLPDKVIWTVAFNTSDYGSSPVGPADCQTGPGGCPYDSLNVGDKTYGAVPFAGTDTDPNGVFLSSTYGGSYCDGGTAGTGSLRLDTPCWTGLRPLGEILAAPVIP